MLEALLAAALVYRPYTATTQRSRQHVGWVIELAHLLRVPEDTESQRPAREVKREVKAFLTHLERTTAAEPQDAPIAQHLIQTVRNRWWGLFTCYRVRGLPATNNDQETFFHRLKQGQRRITGRKSVQEFILRYGAYAAYLDPHETFDQLLARLRQVRDPEFQYARHVWRETEAPLHKAYRFRHHQAQFLKELEAVWETLVR